MLFHMDMLKGALHDQFTPSGQEEYLGASAVLLRYSFYQPRKDGKLSEL